MSDSKNKGDVPRILGADGLPIPPRPAPKLQAIRQVVFAFLGSGIALAVMGFVGRAWMEQRLEDHGDRLRHDLARIMRDETAKIGIINRIEDAVFAVRESYSGVLVGKDKVKELNNLIGCTEALQRAVGQRRTVMRTATVQNVSALIEAVDAFIREVKRESRPGQLEKQMETLETSLKAVDECVASERANVSPAAQL